ncbi:MAG: acyl-CoA thioesterase [Chloroflexi bacterium]|nr:acyl-CoA thioesterase [Chloroflexota bacterium]
MVELGETDAAGVVFYPNYFRWFDRATHNFLGAIGLPQRELLEEFQLTQPIIDCGCKFVGPLHYDDKVRIETKITDLNDCMFRLDHVVYREDVLVGSGFEVRIWVKTDERGADGKLLAVTIPPVIAERLKGKWGQ